MSRENHSSLNLRFQWSFCDNVLHWRKLKIVNFMHRPNDIVSGSHSPDRPSYAPEEVFHVVLILYSSMYVQRRLGNDQITRWASWEHRHGTWFRREVFTQRTLRRKITNVATWGDPSRGDLVKTEGSAPWVAKLASSSSLVEWISLQAEHSAMTSIAKWRQILSHRRL